MNNSNKYLLNSDQIQERLNELIIPYQETILKSLSNDSVLAPILLSKFMENALETQKFLMNTALSFCNDTDMILEHTYNTYVEKIQNIMKNPFVTLRLDSLANTLNDQQTALLNKLMNQIENLNIPDAYPYEEAVNNLDSKIKEEDFMNPNQMFVTKDDLNDAVKIIIDSFESSNSNTVGNDEENLKEIDTYVMNSFLFLYRYWDNEVFIDLLKVITLYLGSLSSPQEALELINNSYSFISVIIILLFSINRISRFSDTVKEEIHD